ncbi:hypothetical protein VNO80_06484 [Phaseolus coccineus]|uniref:CRM domain-containing protein n=1 Tax=Phaseolus coccineus TaxID=3886 RepID=A0AAN9NLR0_PHACN
MLASKTTVTDFHLLSPPLSDKEGAEVVRLVVPIWESREQVLGKSLTENEINRLLKRAGKSSRPLHIGKDGLTHNMLENIYTYWMRCNVCKIKCIRVCTVNMDNECQQLKERTRGNHSPTFWHSLFRDLVRCLLFSFKDDHILMCRGPNSRTSLPNPRDDDKDATKINVDSGNSNKLPPNSRKLSAACLQKNTVEHLCNEPLDISILSNSDDLSLHQVYPCFTENKNLPIFVVYDATSLPVKTCEVEITEDVMAIFCTPEMVSRTYKNFASTVTDPHSNKLLDGSEAKGVSESSRCAPCTKGVLLLLD